MSELLIAALMWVGAAFMLIAAIGLVRLPDLYMRMHAATKAGTLGISCLVLGVALYFGDLGVTMRALLIVVFFLITAPIAGHMIGHAAYLRRVHMARSTHVDEFREYMFREKGGSSGDDAAAQPGGSRR